MKRFFSLLFFITINLSYLYSLEIAIDFRGANYNEITNTVKKIHSFGQRIYFALIDSPFRKLENTSSIYDFTLEDEKTFSKIISFFSQNNIDTYIYLSLFTQPRYFSRKLWSIEDFTYDSINTSTKYVVDINGNETRDKLKRYFSIIRSVSKKWCFDVSELDDEDRKFLDFCQFEFKESVFLTSKRHKDSKPITIHSENYWNLRKNVFLYPIANLEKISDYVPCNDINFIDSSENSVNNIATIVFLLLKKEKILISYRLIDDFFISLWSFLDSGNFKIFYLSKEKAIFTDKEKFLVINFVANYSCVEFDNLNFSDNVFVFSECGGGWLEKKKGKARFFLFPGSISYYYTDLIKKN